MKTKNAACSGVYTWTCRILLREATSHKGELAHLCGDCRDPASARVREATSHKGELAETGDKNSHRSLYIKAE